MFTLLLRLSGPLQSWGSASLYDNRMTDYYPTKSGVVGMIAAALGIKRDEPLDELSKLKFGIRIDNQGELINDFQITDMGEKLSANLSYRRYLSDAIFLVGLSSDNYDELFRIKEAILNPKFSLFLGRKSCPPTLPIALKIEQKELYDALLEEEWLVPKWRQKDIFRNKMSLNLRIVVEDERGALKKDVPISYNACHRLYEYRYISEKSGKIVYLTNDDTTEHDPMKELEV